MQALLGNLDAKLDKARVDLHRSTFVITRATRRALEDDVPFICGRKGTGKTAVADRLHWDVTNFSSHIAIDENEYDDLHSAFVSMLLNGQYTSHVEPDELARWFFHLWSYILNLAVFQGCAQITDQSAAVADDVAAVRDYLGKVRALKNSPVRVAFWLLRKMLEQYGQRPTAPVDIADKLNALSEGDSYRSAEAAARRLGRHTSILVTIDTLEQYDLSPHRIFPFRGMARAIKAFYERDNYPDVEVKCFLPAEIVDYVFFENRAKYLDLAVTLEWKYTELLEFIGRRYAWYLRQHTLPAARKLGDELQMQIELLSSEQNTSNSAWRSQIWARFAPARIRNRQGTEEDGANYLLRHTQRRPRECLCAMNHIVEAAEKSSDFPLLSPEALITALHDKANLDVMLNSTLSIYKLAEYQGSVQALVARIFANEARVFPAKELRRISSRALSELGGSRAVVQEEIEKLLVRSGLIGAVVSKPAENIAPHEPRYFVAEFEYGLPGAVNLNEDSLCAMHPILADFLGAGAGQSGQPPVLVYPRAEME